MKIKSLLLYVALLSTTSAFAQSERLTNQSVVDLIEAGFSESIIMAKIQTSETDFDISMEALKTLNAKGVPENIIVAIMNAAQKNPKKKLRNPCPASITKSITETKRRFCLLCFPVQKPTH